MHRPYVLVLLLLVSASRLAVGQELLERISPDDLAAVKAAQAQRALSRLGYYQGPQDGRSSPALEGALKAYQKEQGLPVTGQMDAQSSARLAIYAQ